MSDREDSVLTEAVSGAAESSSQAKNANGKSKSKGKGAKAATAGTSNAGGGGGSKSKAKESNGASAGPTFPLTRISRIIKADTDVETTSKDAVWTIAMATEYFIKHLTDSALANARLDKKRTLTYKELASAVDSHSEFFFLNEVIPQPIALEEALRQRRELDAHIRARQVGLVEDEIEDSDEEEQDDDAADENEVSAAMDGDTSKAAAAAKTKAGKKKKIPQNGVEAAASGADATAAASVKGPRKPKVPGTTKSGAPQDPIAWAESRPLKANGQPRLKPGPKPKVKPLAVDGSGAPASDASLSNEPAPDSPKKGKGGRKSAAGEQGASLSQSPRKNSVSSSQQRVFDQGNDTPVGVAMDEDDELVV